MDAIANLWNGRAGLAKTYWGYGILGGVLWSIAISMVTPGSTAALLAVLAVCAYFIVVNMGVWRAATTYTGPATWAMLAKVVSGLGLAVVIGVLVMVAVTLGGGSMKVPHASQPPLAAQPSTQSSREAPNPGGFQFDPSTARKVEDGR